MNGADDQGYLATATMAGTRLRTELKDPPVALSILNNAFLDDVAAAISPMTAEFLTDIAATNVMEAMEYGMNARIETDDARTGA